MDEKMDKKEDLEQPETEIEERSACEEVVADEASMRPYTPEEISALEAVAGKAGEYYNQLLRTRADFDNYRKRIQKENAQYLKFANEGLLLDLLPVVDNFERAIAAAPAAAGLTPEIENFILGVKLSHKMMLDILSRNGVERIQTKGAKFDPRYHEAVDHVETAELDEDTIISETQSGYLFNDRVLRPSTVKVAKKPASDGGTEAAK